MESRIQLILLKDERIKIGNDKNIYYFIKVDNRDLYIEGINNVSLSVLMFKTEDEAKVYMDKLMYEDMPKATVLFITKLLLAFTPVAVIRLTDIFRHKELFHSEYHPDYDDNTFFTYIKNDALWLRKYDKHIFTFDVGNKDLVIMPELVITSIGNDKGCKSKEVLMIKRYPVGLKLIEKRNYKDDYWIH